MNISRIILHIDMNAFFASCEIAENRALLNKPVVVANNDPLRRSIILTANYEARKYGIKTTMSTGEAIKLCPNVEIVEPKRHLYNHYSKLFFTYLKTITPLVEEGSIDEAYLDVSILAKTTNIIELAKRIQKELYDKYLLPCSIGIGPNKFLAKMASDMKKPLGITILRRREIDKYLWPLPIEKMYGVGEKTAIILKEIGIKTIYDLANFENEELLKDRVDINRGMSLKRLANGYDDSIVNTISEVSSMSAAHTFDYDILDENYIKSTMRALVNTLSFRLEEKNLKAQTIGVQIRYSDFKTINRSEAIEKGTNDARTIYSMCNGLFEEHYNFSTPLRLIGVFANRLIDDTEDKIKQFSLFEMDEATKENEIHNLLSDIKATYGAKSISRGIKKGDKKQ